MIQSCSEKFWVGLYDPRSCWSYNSMAERRILLKFSENVGKNIYLNSIWVEKIFTYLLANQTKFRQVTDTENVTENYNTPMNPIEKIQTWGKCRECDPHHQYKCTISTTHPEHQNMLKKTAILS